MRSLEAVVLRRVDATMDNKNNNKQRQTEQCTKLDNMTNAKPTEIQGAFGEPEGDPVANLQ